MTKQQSKPEARPILIAVDFSRDSDVAVEWGLEYATRRGAPVILFHAIHDTAEAPGFYTREGKGAVVDIQNVAKDMMEEQLKRVAKIAERLGSSVPVTTELVEGIPVGRILEVAKADNCSLIVIGTRGRSKVASLLLGSVAETVVQKAEIPVVVVKAQRTSVDTPEDTNDD
jgi:universal stress protein A